MTSQDDLLRELQETFRAEAAEYLETLNMTLLQVERVIDDETKYQSLLTDAFRIAHNMKGAARTMGYNEIDSLSHSIENVLQQARDKTLTLEPSVCDVLYAALDAIKAILNGDTIDLTPIYARLLKVASTTSSDQADSATQTLQDQTLPAVEESALESTTDSADPASTGDKTIRVPVTRLDNLMAEAGELLVSKISAEQHLSDMTELQYTLTLWPKAMDDFNTLLRHISGSIGLELSEHLMQHQEYLQTLTQRVNVLQQHFSRDAIRLGIITNRIQEEVQQVRLMPFGSIAAVLQRAVRDAARTEGKLVNALHITGADVELDKKVLEMLKDPLLHLLRNAVAHGIETPEKRRAVGKPDEGRITVLVQQRGSEIFIEVRDDGSGFDLEALRQHGSSNSNGNGNGNGSTPHDNASVDDLIGLAFLPGVSTAAQVNEIAGRGVGLDVVRNTINNLQGHIDVDTLPGKGTAFQLWVPLSLATTEGLLVRIGTEQYVIPLLSVEKIIQPDKSFSLQGQSMLTVDGKHIPLIPLAYSLNRPQTEIIAEPLAVVIKSGDQQIGLLVEDVIAQQEVTVKPLSKLLHRVSGVAGAALIGNGEPVIVLNIADLMKSARTFKAVERSVERPVVTSQAEPDMIKERSTIHILVVDDSITTRTLEKNILQAAGYHVTTAVDGALALRQIRENTFDLVVSDVQMPNMDGITLAQSIRASSQYNHLPIILVTSLESAEDKQRGLEAGANAYIVKRGFDQAELLETIQRLLLGVQP